MRLAGYVACAEDAGKILVGTPERKRLLGGYTLRCGDNIETNLRRIELVYVDWIMWFRLVTSNGFL
jgi:hypothetical protein